MLIPYIIWGTLSTIARGELPSLWRNLLIAGGGPQYYFVLVYIQFVILTPAIGWLMRSRFRNVGWLIAPAGLLLFKYIPLFSGEPLSSTAAILWGNSCIPWFAFYYLGLLLGNQILKNSCNVKILAVAYAFSLFLQMGEGYVLLTVFDQMNCGTQVKLSALLSSFFFCLLAAKYMEWSKPIALSKSARFFKIVGDASFGIFLCHMLVAGVFKHTAAIYRAIPFCLNSFLILIVSLLCVTAAQKICGRKWGRYLGMY